MILAKKYMSISMFFLITIIAFSGGILLIRRPTLFILFAIACVIIYYCSLNRFDVLFLALATMVLFIPWQKPGLGGWGIPTGRVFDIPVPFTIVIIASFAFLFVLMPLNKTLKPFYAIPVFKFFVIFGISGLISSVLGLNLSNSLWFLLFKLFIPSVCIFYISYRACKNREIFEHILSGLVFTIFLIALYALFEFFTKTNPIESFFASRFPAQYFQSTYVEVISRYRRVAGTLGCPTFLGSVLVTGTCLSAGLFAYSKTFSKKITFFTIIFVNLIVLLLTVNRGGVFGLIIAVLVFAFIIKKQNYWKLLFFVFLFSLITSLAIVLVVAFDVVMPRFTLENILSGPSTQHRLNAYVVTVKFLKYNPLFGIGLANFQEMYHNVMTPFAMEVPTMDNTFLNILSSMGIIGLVTFSVLILSLLKEIILTFRRLTLSEIFPVYVSLFCALIGMLFSFVFYNALGYLAPSFLFWSLAGMGTAVAQNSGFLK